MDKIGESALIKTMHPSRRWTQTNSSSCYGRPIDTLGYRDAIVHVDCGDMPANNTLDIAITENSIADPVGSVVVTGASFTQFTSSSDNTAQTGMVQVRDFKRFLFAKATFGGGGGSATLDFGARIVLGNPVEKPVAQAETLAFDVDELGA